MAIRFTPLTLNVSRCRPAVGAGRDATVARAPVAGVAGVGAEVEGEDEVDGADALDDSPEEQAVTSATTAAATMRR
jgi:hypothetical protein